jgi:hypothetical protein
VPVAAAGPDAPRLADAPPARPAPVEAFPLPVETLDGVRERAARRAGVGARQGGPQPVRPAVSGLEPERPATASERSGPPTGIDLVTTVLQASAELAQIGVTYGGQLLRRAASRLPRP